MTGKPTSVDDILLPVEFVALKHLKTKAGEPVVVKCEAVDDLTVARYAKRLPGSFVSTPSDEDGDMSEEAATEVAERLYMLAPPLIESGTSLVTESGEEVRPAFYFDEKNRGPRSIPGRLLRVEDVTALVEAILRIGGYIRGGAATDSGDFPSRVGVGSSDGVGTLPSSESDGSDAVGVS